MATNPIIQNVIDSPCGHLNPHLVDLATPQKKSGSKYGNKKVEYDGYTFDSKKECVRYQALKTLQIIGEIIDLQLQVSFDLPGCRYEADFVYQRAGRQVVEDVKSAATRKNRVYRLKKKLMKEVLGIEILET